MTEMGHFNRSCRSCQHIKTIINIEGRQEDFCTCPEYLHELDKKPELCNPDYPRLVDYGQIVVDPFNCGMKFWEPNNRDSVRRFVSVQENMKRCRGEIERFLYTAEIACKKQCYDAGLDCSFWEQGCGCILPRIRQLIGDHSPDITDINDAHLGLDAI